MRPDLPENVEDNTEKKKYVSTYRSVFAQVLACSANDMMLFDIGLVVSFATVALAAIFENPDPNEPLKLTSDQASWFASILYLCQPVGSIISGLIVKPLGRKVSMIIVNIPFFIGWVMTYFVQSAALLTLASAILGFGVGCTEAPMLTYIGEVTEPKYRGAITAYSQIFWLGGGLVIYGIGSLVSWRYTAAICALVPIISALLISRIPETPLWLISKGRIQEAEEALCWLRGWVKPEVVKEELQEYIEYNKRVNLKKQQASDQLPTPTNTLEITKEVKMPLKRQITYFFRPEMRRPLILIITYFFYFYASGFYTIRPYLMHVFTELNITMDLFEVTIWATLLCVLATALCSLIVRYTGKKPLSIISMGGCGLSTIGLALVSYYVLSTNWAVPLIFTLAFFTGLGVAPIPWMLQTELYPLEGKCLAAGIAAAFNYIIGFIATKSFLALEGAIDLGGAFVLFSCVSLAGIIYICYRLPETEGKTFEEIEAKFRK